jgi:hypothetical protein
MAPKGFVPVSELLANDPDDAAGLTSLAAIATRTKSAGFAQDLAEEEVCSRFIRVAEIRNKTLLINSVSHDYRDVIEIFDRLNSRGIRYRYLLLKLLHETASLMIGGTREQILRNFHGRSSARE